jgi:hypothetical protein
MVTYEWRVHSTVAQVPFVFFIIGTGENSVPIEKMSVRDSSTGKIEMGYSLKEESR